MIVRPGVLVIEELNLQLRFASFQKNYALNQDPSKKPLTEH